MSKAGAESSNGAHPTRAEHDTLRAIVESIRAEQQLQAASLKFIEHQVRLTGQAMELLLATCGLDPPEDDTNG